MKSLALAADGSLNGVGISSTVLNPGSGAGIRGLATICALAPYITLTEAGAKVPLLVVDGKVLSESVAIQTWIARKFAQAKLLPADPWQELQAIAAHYLRGKSQHAFGPLH